MAGANNEGKLHNSAPAPPSEAMASPSDSSVEIEVATDSNNGYLGYNEKRTFHHVRGFTCDLFKPT